MKCAVPLARGRARARRWRSSLARRGCRRDRPAPRGDAGRFRRGVPARRPARFHGARARARQQLKVHGERKAHRSNQARTVGAGRRKTSARRPTCRCASRSTDVASHRLAIRWLDTRTRTCSGPRFQLKGSLRVARDDDGLELRGAGAAGSAAYASLTVKGASSCPLQRQQPEQPRRLPPPPRAATSPCLRLTCDSRTLRGNRTANVAAAR